MATDTSHIVEKTTKLDAIADDAELPEYPEGAPLLQSYLKIRPRSKRAEFKRKFADVSEMQKEIDAIKASGALNEAGDNQAAKLRAWAQLDDMYQQIDELLEMAAVNPAAYREWSDTTEDDTQLVAVFNAYMKRTQPGEASSSAS